MSLAGIGFALERLYPHLFHPGENLFAVTFSPSSLNMPGNILESANGWAVWS